MFRNSDYSDLTSSRTYNIFLLLSVLTFATYLMTRYAESQNRLDYEDRLTRIISGLLRIIANTWHTKSGQLEIKDAKGQVLAVGPHRCGFVDAVSIAAITSGTPPRFFATDGFNWIPGMKRFMAMTKAIPIAANPTKTTDGKSANAVALDLASEALGENGCVALFPQGNFSRIGEEPPRVYEGAARLALRNNAPIQVIRLDGVWSMSNWLIPVSIRNDRMYRALFSAFHMNNVRATRCCVIDFHQKPESQHLSHDQKVEEICAQLYAFFRHTNDLSPKQIDVIKTEITDKMHLTIWKNKVEQDKLERQLVNLKKEGVVLGEQTARAMKKIS